jgi:formiminotetrahydrofolate cyclodeaminase
MTNKEQDALQDRRIGDYLERVASSEPAPGGGSVAGVVMALGASLGEMVANLTDDAAQDLVAATARLTALRSSAVTSGAADELAYPAYLEASRMPKASEEEKARRKAMMQGAMEEAAAIPMQLAETGVEILEALQAVVLHGNRRVMSDAEVAIILARAAIDASLVNVRVNSDLIRDPETSANLETHARAIEDHAARIGDALARQLAEGNGRTS